LASRHHVRNLLPVIDAALARAEIGLDAVDAIAVTCGPGLIGSLLVGLSVAKGIAHARGLPIVGVNHLEGHLLAANLDRPPDDPIAFPFLGLIVSGGHTGLYLARGAGDYRCLGRTRDDAVGEAFDKVAKLLGLGYPGGPAIERLAEQGDPKAIRLPRTRMAEAGAELGVDVVFPRFQLCTDTAAMIAMAGWRRLEAGEDDGLAIGAEADLPFGAPVGAPAGAPDCWELGRRRGGRSPAP